MWCGVTVKVYNILLNHNYMLSVYTVPIKSAQLWPSVAYVKAYGIAVGFYILNQILTFFSLTA